MKITKKIPLKVLFPLCIFGSWLAAAIVIILYTMNSLQISFNDINWGRISDKATMNIVKLFSSSDDNKTNMSAKIYQKSQQFSNNERNSARDEGTNQEKIPDIINTKDKSADNLEKLSRQTFSVDKFTQEDFSKSLEMGITPAAGQAQKVW